MEEPGLAQRDELPPACTLGPDDGPARMRRWRRLAEQAQPTVQRTGHDLEVRFPPAPGVREELESLAAAERQCCSFVSWTVTQDAGRPVLHVTAPVESPDDVEPIAALFGAG